MRVGGGGDLVGWEGWLVVVYKGWVVRVWRCVFSG